MFFSSDSRGGAGKIERALMDGRQREGILSEGLVSPLGLAVDPPTQDLYWVDRDTVSRSDYHGDHRTMLTRLTKRTSLTGLSVFQNKLFLPAMSLNAVVSLDKFHPSNLSM